MTLRHTRPSRRVASTSGLVALVAGLVLALPGASLAASQHTSVTGSGTSGAVTIAVNASSNADGSSPSGTLGFQFPAGTFPTNPSATSLTGNVALGCVIRTENTVDVVGRLPANERWTFESPAGSGNFVTIEWVGVRIVDVGTATSTPVDLVRASAQFTATGANICAGNGWPATSPAPTLLSSGDFAVTSPFNDSNGDGIVQSLQPSGTPAGSFADTGTTPHTTGSIQNANGLSVLVTDALDPLGVTVTVGAGSGSASTLVCGFPVAVAAGSTVNLTCSSVIVEVVVGSASVAIGGGTTVIAVPEGGVVEVTDFGDGSFEVENLGATDISVTVGNVESTVAPGQTLGGWVSASARIHQIVSAVEGLAAVSGRKARDKLEDVVAKLEQALAKLGKSPSDRQGAAGELEGAAGDLEAAVGSRLVSSANGVPILAEIAGAARSLGESAIADARARGGRPAKIAEAETALAAGDFRLAAGRYKDAVARYKDAVSKAEGA